MLGKLTIAAAIVLPYAAAQSAQCNTSSSEFQWSYNSLKQSPCDISQYLGGVCTSGAFVIQPLAPNTVYLGPTKENTNDCRCSTVYYSVLSACATCQDRNFLKWSSYSTECSTVYLNVFPEAIPSGTRVPNYAYDDVLALDGFNITMAETVQGPESTSTPKPTGSGSIPTISPGSSSSSSHAGAIAGGVVGGIAGLAIIAGLAFWWTRRRRNSVPPSQSADLVPVAPVPMRTHNDSPFTPSTQTQKVYNPSDPSTFPSTPATSDVHEFEHQPLMYPSSGYTDSTRGRTTYTGVPEV